MKKFIILLLITIFAIGCCAKKQNQNQIDTRYEVYKIDSINNFYIIYAQNDNIKYKIISEKQVDNSCKKIQLNKEYSFKLISILQQKIQLGDKTFSSADNLLVNCFTFEGNTKICREKDISDLHRAENLKGLCLVK